MPRKRPGAAKVKTRYTMSDAEREIRQAQAEKIARRKHADEADEALAEALRRHIGDGTPVAEIGTWLVSDERPNGVSRQQVYNIAGKPKKETT